MRSKKESKKDFQHLSPEQKRAVKVLLGKWPKSSEFLAKKTLPPYFKTGFHHISLNSVEPDFFPSEDHWIWRQCNAKLKTKLDDTTNITIQKFNTRKKNGSKSDKPRPSYKLWKLDVEQSPNIKFSFLYCERGVNETITPEVKTSVKQNEETFQYTEEENRKILPSPQLFTEIDCGQLSPSLSSFSDLGFSLSNNDDVGGLSLFAQSTHFLSCFEEYCYSSNLGQLIPTSGSL